MENTREGERIAKVIARAGICSRRAAETLIAEGKVKVDGLVINSPAVKVTDKNTIMVDNKPLPNKEQVRLWIFHKPRGCLTTNKDPDGRQTIFDLLPKTLPRVITIGRLDYNSEGILLLTNDGGLARNMELPSSGWVRKYRARAYGSVNMRLLEEIRQGATVEDVKYEPADVEVETSTGDNFWLNISVKEGKNREVRKLLDYAGLTVSRLIRTEYGPFKLGATPRGKVIEVPGVVYDKDIPFEYKAPAKEITISEPEPQRIVRKERTETPFRRTTRITTPDRRKPDGRKPTERNPEDRKPRDRKPEGRKTEGRKPGFKPRKP